jgi:hypothetical protein
MMKIEGSGSESESGSISQRHGTADSDPHQNVMDPQHWFYGLKTVRYFHPSVRTDYRYLTANLPVSL